MTTQEIIDYYANLLVLQYLGQPNAYATIQNVVTGPVMDQIPTQVQNAFNLNAVQQTMNFSDVPASGNFSIVYNGLVSNAIYWDYDLTAIQATMNALLGFGVVTVTGDLFSQSLVFTFNSPASPLILSTSLNTLANALSVPITITVDPGLAIGVQLDTIGKYAGVTRTGFGSTGPVTLDDSDFLQLIRLAIITNNSGSSLYDIDNLLNTYFPGEILVFDKSPIAPMYMQYLVSSSIGSQGLIELFISEGLLPRPMGVGITVIVAPTVTDFFGLCDYATATPTSPNTVNSEPMNCAAGYSLSHYVETWPVIDYNEAV